VVENFSEVHRCDREKSGSGERGVAVNEFVAAEVTKRTDYSTTSASSRRRLHDFKKSLTHFRSRVVTIPTPTRNIRHPFSRDQTDGQITGKAFGASKSILMKMILTTQVISGARESRVFARRQRGPRAWLAASQPFYKSELSASIRQFRLPSMQSNSVTDGQSRDAGVAQNHLHRSQSA
jgi:hypothetical protein